MSIYNKEPRCPNCQSVYDIDRNESYHLYSDDDIHELECNECNEVFFVKTHKSFMFECDTNIDML